MTIPKFTFFATPMYRLGTHLPPQQLQELFQLEDGWHHGTGSKPSEHAIEAAKKLWLYQFEYFHNAEFFPGKDGSILFSIFRHDLPYETFDITCRPDGLYNLVQEVGDEEILEKNGIDLTEILKTLEEAGWQVGSSRTSYTRASIPEQRRDLLAIHFPSPPMEEYRASTSIVLNQLECRFAST